MINLLVLQSLLEKDNIRVSAIIDNNKASEVYVRTSFIQDDGFKWNTYVPFVDRRAGLDIDTEQELAEYLISLKPYFTQQSMDEWRETEKTWINRW